MRLLFASPAVVAVALLCAMPTHADTFVKVVDTTDVEPGTSTTFQDFYSGSPGFYSLNNIGQVAFAGLRNGGTGSRDDVLCLWTNGSTQRIVGVGDAAPGDNSPGSNTFDIVDSLSLNDSGTVTFQDDSGNGGANGIFKYNGSSIQRLGGSNISNPDGSTGGNIQEDTIHQNNSGEIVYRQSSANVFTLNPDATIATFGNSNSGQDFRTIYQTAINNGGEVAFAGLRADQSNFGIWTSSGGDPTSLVEAGDTLVDGATANDISLQQSEIGVADDGTVFFEAQTGGTTADTTIYAYDGPGGNRKIVANGQLDPEGGVMSGITNFSVSNNGIISFLAFDGTLGGDRIFTETPTGTLTTMVSVGDSLFGSTITSLNNVQVNDSGEIAFGYGLHDNRFGIATVGGISGLAVTAPESSPAYFVLIGLPLAILAFRRRISRAMVV